MRLQGKIETWNDERGFGFVVQNSTGKRAFVHISALADRRRRPAVGALVTYELVNDKRGPKAVQVRYVGRKVNRERRPGFEAGPIAAGLVALLVVGYVVQVWKSHPNSTVGASVHKIVFARDALRKHPEFSCGSGKTHCSHMSSCAEAYFHQEQCGATEMDGDDDGIPCERQWCQ
jgi:cold shock CspA family protein